MASTIRVRNTTGAVISIESLGLVVPALSSVDVDGYLSITDIIDSTEIQDNVESGALVINNGVEDIAVTDMLQSALFSDEKVVTQTGHGYSLTANVPLPAYTSLPGDVELALSDDKNTLSAYYITGVVDANTLKIRPGGRFHTAPSHGLTIGHYYFLSDSVPGGVVIDQPTGVIDDPAFFVVDANTLLLLDNRPVDKFSLHKPMIKVTNTDTATDLCTNESPGILVPIVGNVDINEESLYTTAGTTQIVVPRTATYELYFHAHLSSLNARSNVRFQFEIDGTPVSAH